MNLPNFLSEYRDLTAYQIPHSLLISHRYWCIDASHSSLSPEIRRMEWNKQKPIKIPGTFSSRAIESEWVWVGISTLSLSHLPPKQIRIDDSNGWRSCPFFILLPILHINIKLDPFHQHSFSSSPFLSPIP